MKLLRGGRIEDLITRSHSEQRLKTVYNDITCFSKALLMCGLSSSNKFVIFLCPVCCAHRLAETK